MPGAADAMLAEHAPSIVVHLAADVGGIGYNLDHPARLYLSNLLMGTNVIEATRQASTVDKTVLVGTVCSYPKFTPVPFSERDLWEGYPEETNAPYGIAKKAHLVHAQVNEHEYGQRFAYLIPTNLYGPGDKFHPSVSHVIPALIKKCVEAKEAGADRRSTCGAPDPRAASTSTSTMLPKRSCGRPRSTRPPSRSTSAPTARSRSRRPSRPSLASSDSAVNCDGTHRSRMANLGGRSTAPGPETCLGWSPTMEFEAGLRATIDWYLANRDDAERDPH